MNKTHDPSTRKPRGRRGLALLGGLLLTAATAVAADACEGRVLWQKRYVPDKSRPGFAQVSWALETIGPNPHACQQEAKRRADALAAAFGHGFIALSSPVGAEVLDFRGQEDVPVVSAQPRLFAEFLCMPAGVNPKP